MKSCEGSVFARELVEVMIATIVEWSMALSRLFCTTTAGRTLNPCPDTKAIGRSSTSLRLSDGAEFVIAVVVIHLGIGPSRLGRGL
jgi:hypothetical protein